MRKHNRLSHYDYSSNGAYFITMCTKDRTNILGDIIGKAEEGVGDNDVDDVDDVGANCVRLNPSNIGQIVLDEIVNLNTVYDTVSLDCYVVMPNHIHMIIMIDCERRTQFAPTISTIVKQFKGKITKEIGYSIWQKSFHDHVIRDERDYTKIYEYIQTNPLKWKLDKYFA